MERLDKVISNFAGITRTEAKEYLKKGLVTVNEIVVKDGSSKVKDEDEIKVKGETLDREKYRYFMLNKPKGYISSTEEDVNSQAKDVISIFAKEKIKGLFPVGRLDKDTTGLIIITNDGELGHKLTAPSRDVKKTYEAELKGILKEEHIQAFEEGFVFKEFTSKPARLEIISVNEKEEKSVARVTISEGKFHQVKRMFLKVGCVVTELKRISEGSLELDETLNPGEYRKLTVEEINGLKAE